MNDVSLLQEILQFRGELEDRLAMLDDRLTRVTLEPNAPERSERLWRERAEVMNSLVQVRYADAIGAY